MVYATLIKAILLCPQGLPAAHFLSSTDCEMNFSKDGRIFTLLAVFATDQYSVPHVHGNFHNTTPHGAPAIARFPHRGDARNEYP